MRRPIVKYGNDVLRQRAQRVEVITEEIRMLIRDMIETMRAEGGVGLAAQQVGSTWSVCVLDVPPSHDSDEKGNRLHPHISMPWVLINPRLVWSSKEKETAEEGCLSFPGIFIPIARPREIVMRFMDMQGEYHEERVTGFLARAVQHEIDHLNGVLFIDRASPVKRVTLRSALRKLRESAVSVAQ